MRAFYYDKGRYVEIPFERLKNVRVVDGSGVESADQVTVEYHANNEPNPLPQLIVEQDLEEGPILHGPYDLQTQDYDPATRTATLSGTKNLFWEERLSAIGTAQERAIRDQLEAVMTALRVIQPYALWLSDDGIGFDTLVGTMTSELTRVRNFSSLMQQLQTNGLIAFTYNLFDANGLASAPIVSFIPRYPTALRGSQYELRGRNKTYTVDINQVLRPTEEEGFRISRPDLTNPPGRWRTRRIISSQRQFAHSDDVLYFVSGSDRESPTVYSDNVVGQGYTQQDHDQRRWEMQNTARSCTLKQAYDIMYETPLSGFAIPHQIVRARDDWWLVNTVEHSWDADSGYIRTIMGTQWQGGFQRIPIRSL